MSAVWQCNDDLRQFLVCVGSRRAAGALQQVEALQLLQPPGGRAGKAGRQAESALEHTVDAAGPPFYDNVHIQVEGIGQSTHAHTHTRACRIATPSPDINSTPMPCPADDVLFYPSQFNASGYSPTLLKGDIQLPPTVNESLLTKVGGAG